MSHTSEPSIPSGEYAICLIGGTGRSGTTVLRQIFALHPDVASLDTEARFLADPDGLVDFDAAMSGGWSPYSFDTKLRRLEKLLRDLGGSRRFGFLTRPDGISPARRRSGSDSGFASRWRSTLSGHGLARLLPRYWAINLAVACPAYPELVEELVNRLVEFRFAGRWMGLPLRRRSSMAYGSPDVSDALRWFCRRFVSCVCDAQNATHFVEDTPFNVLYFDGIRRLLPESRLVHIHRDPRDVVASYLHRTWSPSDPEMAARFYVEIMRRWEAVRESLPPDSFIEVGLAALLDQPEAVLRRVCEFWGLPWTGALLGVDLSRSNRGRWRTELPPKTLRRVEEILGVYMERYGDLE